MLYCRLTRSNVNNVRSEIEKHVEGRRFTTKVYQQWRKAILKRKKKLIFQLKMERKVGISLESSPATRRYKKLVRLTRWAVLRIK